MFPRIGLVVISALLLGLFGCSSSGPPKFEKPPVRVLCTTTIVGDVVKRVGGDRVEVELLMGAGVDPHTYKPEPADRAKMEKAHLVFFNGLHLEGKMVDLLEKSKDKFRAFAVTRDIDPSLLRTAEIDGGHHDPHVWFDVMLWSKTINVVRDELSKLDPAGTDLYKANAEAYRKELEALDAEVRAKINTLPKEKRILVTSHDAFGYFGRAYGFEVRGLQGVSTASEPSTKDVQEVAAYLGKNRVSAVFTETSVPTEGLKALLDTVKKDAKFEVKLIGGDDALYSDALGDAGTPGGTYAGMIRHNVTVIVDALAK
jgi:manganese/zinc/iron transport system substrate-binding protein